VDNTRYGLDLTWSRKPHDSAPIREKVGFMTIDRFTRTPIASSGGALPTGSPITQFEFELLPEAVETYEGNRKAFHDLFEQIERTYGGSRTTVPKYRQSADPSAGRAGPG